MTSSYYILPVLAYLLGSIPFGLIIGKIRGVDVRLQGSGNIGSTNVGRVLGQPWGYICFLLDVAKGTAPVVLAGYILTSSETEITPQACIAWMIVAVACILGHMFSLFLKFKGGKGVATSLGVILGIYPYFTLAGIVVFLIWAAIWGTWRYVSLASIIAALCFPMVFVLLVYQIDTWSMGQLWPLLAFASLVALLVVVRHRSNIKRLRAGTENRGGRKKQNDL